MIFEQDTDSDFAGEANTESKQKSEKENVEPTTIPIEVINLKPSYLYGTTPTTSKVLEILGLLPFIISSHVLFSLPFSHFKNVR